jgi:hypothetical protein
VTADSAFRLYWDPTTDVMKFQCAVSGAAGSAITGALISPVDLLGCLTDVEVEGRRCLSHGVLQHFRVAD